MMLTHAAWDRIPGLRHGLLDARDCRAAPDWERVLAPLGVRLPLTRPRQVHGAVVLVVDDVTPTFEADAVVSTRPGIAVGIVTADCAPVLLRDRGGRSVAAVHAGWRGAAAGVLENALAALKSRAGVDTHDVEAVIGPAAGGCCYEVGADVHGALAARAPEAFTPHRDRHLFDLRVGLETLARAAGVAEVRRIGPCTICDRAYASYRRDGEAAGRQLSFIALT
jgi:YfiH family protein